MARQPLGRDERARRRAERVGAVGVLAAAALPVLLWRDVIADIAAVTADQRLSLAIAGWAPWVLMALGLLCAIPVAVTRWQDRRSVSHRRGAGAWYGWGVTLYLLGFGLATQVAQMHDVGA